MRRPSSKKNRFRRYLQSFCERITALTPRWPTPRMGAVYFAGVLAFLAGAAIAPVTWWQDKPIFLVLSTLVMMLLYPSSGGEQ